MTTIHCRANCVYRDEHETCRKTDVIIAEGGCAVFKEKPEENERDGEGANGHDTKTNLYTKSPRP